MWIKKNELRLITTIPMIATMSDEPDSAYRVLRTKLEDHMAKASDVVLSQPQRMFSKDSIF